MAITNDVALITFVPFAIETLRMARMEEKIVSVAVLQTVAANLGSMVTPIGNPQNIYLYLQSGMSTWDFLKVTGPFAVLAFVLLAGFSMAGRDKEIAFGKAPAAGGSAADEPIDRKVWIYACEFIICIAALTEYVPVMMVALLCGAVAFIIDRKTLLTVDYHLLLTFAGFFIFVGNMGRLPALSQFISGVLEGSEVLVTALVSQVISNVPATILLTGFTDSWEALIIGSNIGGLGTLIASMANLITYKYINKECAHFRHAYVRWFTIMSVVFLAAEFLMYLVLYFVL